MLKWVGIKQKKQARKSNDLYNESPKMFLCEYKHFLKKIQPLLSVASMLKHF